MEDFKLDSKVRLQEQLQFQKQIQHAVNVESLKEEVFIPKMVPIPYTPPKTVWKPNTATLRAFASQCIKSILP
jgi:hypothetical protein